MTKMMAIGPKSNHVSESIPSVVIDEEATRNENSTSSRGGHCKSSSCGHKNQNGPNVDCELAGSGAGISNSVRVQDKCEDDNKKNHHCRKPETTTTYSFDALSKFDGANNVTLPLSSRRSHERTASQRLSWESFDDRFKVSLSSISDLINGHTTLTIVFSILALLQGAILGFWINLYHTINTTMPHTFSWLSLLNPMGSIFTVEECSSTQELLESTSKSKCDVTHSSPLIPLVGICLSSFGLFNTAVFLGCSSCRKAVLLYFLVLLFSGISCGVLLSNNLNGLRELMTQEMDIFKHRGYGDGGEEATTNETFRWKLTQSSVKLNINECCGLNGFSDWLSASDFQNNFEDSASALKSIPTSCFPVKNEWSEQRPLLLGTDSKVKAEDKSGPILLPGPVPVVGPTDKIHENKNKKVPAERGCYDLEYNKILFYAKYQVGLLILGFITSIGLYRVAKRLSFQTERCNGGGGGILKKEKFENPQSHRIFIRQGSNITAFGGQGRSSHVIRKNSILMEATGALASSTGVNENVISLEILNYSESLDKVQVTRESDRIIIMVTKHGILRGKAMLTAKDDQDLERVLVTPTSFGINISV